MQHSRQFPHHPIPRALIRIFSLFVSETCALGTRFVRRSLAICGAAAWISILLLIANPVWSQSSISLHGKVTDPSGAAIPNATVHLINSADNSEHTATTDQQGSYNLSHVAPGTYRVVINAQGFQAYEKAGIQLLANGPAALDVQLTIEQLQQNVTVKAQPTGQCVAPLGRILPGVGPGLRAIRSGPSGNYYVLTSPGASAVIYSSAGKRLGQIPAQPSASSSIVNGSDLQIDSAGRVYVADLAANAIKIYSPEGVLIDKIAVTAPISVEPLPRGEVAVASLYSQHIVDVYDQTLGDLDRSFGDISGPVEHCDAAILRCTTDEQDATALANRPWFYGDAAGNLYVSVGATPAPTIRKYDPYGIRAFEFTMPLNLAASASNNSDWTVGTGASAGAVNSTSGGSASSAGPAAENDSTRTGTGGTRGRGQNQGMLRLGLQITQHTAQPESNPASDAIGVDPANSDVWVVIGDNLVHLDRSGELDESYCLSTSAQSAVKFTTILIEPRRILLGSDPFGVFEYPRPDKSSTATGPPPQ
jgi:hypothetical protein